MLSKNYIKTSVYISIIDHWLIVLFSPLMSIKYTGKIFLNPYVKKVMTPPPTTHPSSSQTHKHFWSLKFISKHYFDECMSCTFFWELLQFYLKLSSHFLRLMNRQENRSISDVLHQSLDKLYVQRMWLPLIYACRPEILCCRSLHEDAPLCSRIFLHLKSGCKNVSIHRK